MMCWAWRAIQPAVTAYFLMFKIHQLLHCCCAQDMHAEVLVPASLEGSKVYDFLQLLGFRVCHGCTQDMHAEVPVPASLKDSKAVGFLLLSGLRVSVGAGHARGAAGAGQPGGQHVVWYSAAFRGQGLGFRVCVGAGHVCRGAGAGQPGGQQVVRLPAARPAARGQPGRRRRLRPQRVRRRVRPQRAQRRRVARGGRLRQHLRRQPQRRCALVDQDAGQGACLACLAGYNVLLWRDPVFVVCQPLTCMLQLSFLCCRCALL